MKKSSISFVAVVTMCVVFAGMAFAQPAQSPVDYWGVGLPATGQVSQVTKAPTIITISGEIWKIGRVSGAEDGLQMELKEIKEAGIGGQMHLVYLGPKWFVEHQKMKLSPRDVVEVRGARITSKGVTWIVATEVRNDRWIMKLRNEEDGMPTWDCCTPRQEMKK